MKLIIPVIIVILQLAASSTSFAQYYYSRPKTLGNEFLAEKKAAKEKEELQRSLENERANRVLTAIQKASKRGAKVLPAKSLLSTDRELLKRMEYFTSETDWFIKKMNQDGLESWLPRLSEQNRVFMESGKFESEVEPFLIDHHRVVRKLSLQVRDKELAYQEKRREAELRKRKAIAQKRQREAKYRNRTAKTYRDSSGRLVSADEVNELISSVRRDISAMPSSAKREFLKGYLEGVEDEWRKTKAKGPVN